MCSGGINQIWLFQKPWVGAGGGRNKVMIVTYKNNIQFYVVHTTEGRVEAKSQMCMISNYHAK